MVDGNQNMSSLLFAGFRISPLLLTPPALFRLAWSGAVSQFGADDLKNRVSHFCIQHLLRVELYISGVQ